MPTCRICQTTYQSFLSFGKMPIANGFLTPDQFHAEYFFELQVGFCPHCHMVQLVKQPDRSLMFHQEYAFFSSTSTRMARHFQEFADLVIRKHLTISDPFIVELGSNDGILLQHFAKAGMRHLGIEPSANVAQVAVKKGITTITEFFDDDVARKIVQTDGQADVILAANVMCHIPYLHSVLTGIETLLKPDGLLIFEDPYLGDIITKISYDQIYDEHVFYFSLESVSNLCESHDLEVISVIPQPVHGGSMRYVIAHKGVKKKSQSVVIQQVAEEALGLSSLTTYAQLRQRIASSQRELRDLLASLKQQGKMIAGYGATSKSATVTNYCGIGPDILEFISDTTPIKQGKYSPGMHIPVRPYQEFSTNYPDYALLFAWNHAEEILAKEQAFIQSGGKWIVYVPKAQVIE
ncbi:MAG: class I SAM-dependent methyltransferase [bacterium]|nr:class I SAM-dependent methyltransferase [bacterium]